MRVKHYYATTKKFTEPHRGNNNLEALIMKSFKKKSATEHGSLPPPGCGRRDLLPRHPHLRRTGLHPHPKPAHQGRNILATMAPGDQGLFEGRHPLAHR